MSTSAHDTRGFAALLSCLVAAICVCEAVALDASPASTISDYVGYFAYASRLQWFADRSMHATDQQRQPVYGLLSDVSLWSSERGRSMFGHSFQEVLEATLRRREEPSDIGLDGCLTDITIPFDNRTSLVKVLDTFGKLPAGVLDGNLLWLGSFDACNAISLKGGDNTSFVWNYCRIGARVTTPKTNSSIIEAALGLLSLGVCVPKSCSDAVTFDQLLSFVNDLPYGPRQHGFEFFELSCFKGGSSGLQAVGIVSLLVLALLFVAVLAGTLLTQCLSARHFDVVRTTSSSPDDFTTDDSVAGANGPEKVRQMDNASPASLEESSARSVKTITTTTSGVADSSTVGMLPSSDKGGFNRILVQLTCIFAQFSLSGNLRKLLSTSSSPTDIPCLHGIRVVSLGWVIIGHTYLFGATVLVNPLKLIGDFDDMIFHVIPQGIRAVDSFFLLSGILLSYHFLNTVRANANLLKSGRFWCSFYVYRFLRLSVPYYLVLLVYLGLNRYFGSGPLWPADGLEYRTCRNSWWTNVLYLNNLVSVKRADGSDDFCMGWSWFLANDMQFFVLSPLILYPLARIPDAIVWKIIAFTTSSVLVAISVASAWIIAAKNGYPPIILDVKHPGLALDMFREVYIHPWCRIAPFVIGLIFGYVLANGWRLTANGLRAKILVQLSLVLNSTVMTWVIFGLVPYFRGYFWPRGVSPFYLATSPTIWALCVCWFIVTCMNGHGEPFNSILCWKLFIPLSRLTYCAYLLHPILLMAYFQSVRVPIFFSHFTMVCYFFSFFVMSYMAALCASLFFESPFLALTKGLRSFNDNGKH